MHEFWYDHVKPKYGKKAKLYSMDTDSFVVYIEIDDIYKELAKVLKQGLRLQIINQINHCLKEKIKK